MERKRVKKRTTIKKKDEKGKIKEENWIKGVDGKEKRTERTTLKWRGKKGRGKST